MVSSIGREPAATLRKAAHIQRLLEPDAIRPVYQPIVRLSDLQPIGYEGLARFPYAHGLSHLPPDITLAAAGEIGLRGDLEVACWAAMAAAGSPPAGRLLFVNISPDALSHPGLFELADRLPSRLVIEITEQHEVQDYERLRSALAPWVARGAQVAIDDTGAGYASLEQVVEMRPDFLKLTRALVADIDRDPNRQALLRALGAFAREVGAGIVAEGVEREEELEILRDAKVDFAQGWLFGRPGPPWVEVPRLASATPTPPSLTDSAIRRMDKAALMLNEAVTVKAACQAVVDHLAPKGLMPSVYLEQGGRLRCQAAHGYWQVFDGMPPESGVIGRAYRSGDVVAISDVVAAPDYMSLVQAVKAEIAVPIAIGSRIAGVVNVESTTPMGEDARREIVRTTELLGRRLAQIGPTDRPSPGQRLARAAARGAAETDFDKVLSVAAAAAVGTSGMESAAIVLRGPAADLSVRHVVGPFADAFRDLRLAELAAMDSWVDAGTSVVSVGDPLGKGPPATRSLREAGAGALVIVPLAVLGTRLGFIAAADRSRIVLNTEEIELLELLGAQAAAQLRGLTAVQELRDRAARDPLTGLGHHAAFQARLSQRRRQGGDGGRQLAVVLADVDGFRDLNEQRGHAAGDEILRQVAGLLQDVAPEGASAYRVGGDEFAMLVDAEHRAGAQEVAWQLQAQARDRLGTTLSIGVALAVDGETDSALLERVDDALGAVKSRGRDGVALAPAPGRSPAPASPPSR